MSSLPARFRLLWAATAVSNLGDGVRVTALPLLATELTRDPRLVAGVVVAERIPWLLFILPGGAWADRYDRRRLRVGLDLVRAGVVAVLTLLVATGHVNIVAVFAAAAVLAAAESIVDSSSMALVPSLVDHDDLERSASVLSATELTMESVIGPPLGGLLFAASLSIPFGVDAASFAIAALLASMIPGRVRAAEPRSSDSDEATPTKIRGEIAAGMRWLWGQPLLRNLALVSTALGTASFVSSSVLVLFAREVLDLGSVGYGLLLVPAALGGILGSVVAPRLRGLPLAATLTASVVVSGATALGIAASSSVGIVACLLAVQYGAILNWNVLTLALRQRLIPDEMLGRVGSSYRFLVFLGMPVGALLGGVLGSALGLREAFAVSGVVLLLAAVFVPAAVRASPARPESG